MRLRRLVQAALLLGPLPAFVEAQGLSGVDSGAVVRMRFASDSIRVGKVLSAFHSDSAVLRYCPYPGLSCPPAQPHVVQTRVPSKLDALEVRVGSRAERGALIGAGVGAGVLALGAVLLQGVGGDGEVQMRPVTRVFAVVSVIAVSATVGALIGSAKDRWRPFIE